MDSGTVASTTPAVPADSGDYDMGARRFGPDLGSFLQQDQFAGALADLGLATDPLTQNRYALAGGNPISYVEWDGHIPTADNPVSANPTLNVQLNATKLPATNSPWSGKDRFVGCACKGLAEEVEAANKAQQQREQRAREAYIKGPAAGLDADWCVRHPIGDQSMCQLIDAGGRVAEGANRYLGPVADFLVGDIERCAEKAISSCALAAASFIPVGKVGKAAKGAVEVAKTLRAANAAKPNAVVLGGL